MIKYQKFTLLITIVLGFLLTGCSGPAESFSVIVLPDTQCYADTRVKYAAERWQSGDLRSHFFRQMKWIKDNQEPLNIVMVAHAGDIVQTDYAEEWDIADQAFKIIDGRVPYILCVGNHDMGYRANADQSMGHTAVSRATLFNKYFGPARFADRKWYGDHFGSGNENYYCFFDAAGMKFIIISLEFKPRTEVLNWADKIVAQHSDRRCIVLTHSYLRTDGSYNNDSAYAVVGNSGAEIWEKFVSQHPNIFLVLCGHVFGEGLLSSTTSLGNTVHQVLADYQDENDGGDGFLRIMTFFPAQDKIEVKTYSPVLDKYRIVPGSQFSLPYPMQQKFHKKKAG
jgi:hypothetical protein